MLYFKNPYELMTKKILSYCAGALALLLMALPLTGFAADSTTAGELIQERPTLICLGFIWQISGDDNGNALCEVRYRKAGTAEWKESLPLYRIGAGRTVNYGFGNFGDPAHAKLRYEIPAGLSGSILDLEPGTEYEVALKIVDPDGVEGVFEKTLKASTRPEPQPHEGGEVRHVYPPGYKGEKLEPTYGSIMHAVNGFHPWCDCYQMVHPNAAPPGTIVKVHAGEYKIDYQNYRTNPQFWLSGTRTLIADGEPGNPIAIVAAGDGEVIIDANGADTAFNVMAADYLYFEGLTIKNTRIAFHGGLQGVIGCKGLTVKNCWLENIQYGVLAQDGRSEDFYIADNVFLGKNPQNRFNPESGGAWGRTEGGYAVNLSGQGHVVCYNYLSGMWDGLNVFTNALADPELKQQARAIDFYNNDVFNSTDNFMEMDGGYSNIRALRNRMINCMAAPVSMQSVYAGPGYWVRNIMWNTHKGRTSMKGGGSAEMMVFVNNTTSCHMQAMTSNWDVRNNVFAGPTVIEPHRKTGKVRAIAGYHWPQEDKVAIVDYNSYLVGPKTEPKFLVGSEMYPSLQAMTEATGYEKHGGIFQSYDVFAKAFEPTHAASNEDPLVYAHELDLYPADGAPTIDAGTVIPGVSEQFEGNAPDMGALEKGQAAPIYGPRSQDLIQRLEPIRTGTDLPEWGIYVAETEEEN